MQRDRSGIAAEAEIFYDLQFGNSSDITISVVDTCSGAGTIASDTTTDFRKRIQLRQSDIAGRCLQMRATALRTPAGGTTFYTADYYHSGDADTQHYPGRARALPAHR